MGWKKPIKQTVVYARLAVCGDSEKAVASFTLLVSLHWSRACNRKKISGNKYGLYLNPKAKQIIL